MKLKIVQNNRNALLGRQEIIFEASDFDTTPSRKEIMEKILVETNSKPELAVIDTVLQKFGTRKVSGHARIYDDQETMKLAEQGFLTARTEGRKGKKQEKEQKPEEQKK